jgi:hypothetical protein
MQTKPSDHLYSLINFIIAPTRTTSSSNYNLLLLGKLHISLVDEIINFTSLYNICTHAFWLNMVLNAILNNSRQFSPIHIWIIIKTTKAKSHTHTYSPQSSSSLWLSTNVQTKTQVKKRTRYIPLHLKLGVPPPSLLQLWQQSYISKP